MLADFLVAKRYHVVLSLFFAIVAACVQDIRKYSQNFAGYNIFLKISIE